LQHRDNGILPLKVHHLSGGYTATQPIEVEISLQFPAEARPLALHLLVRHASYLRVLTELVKTMGRLDREKATQLMDRVLSSDRFSHIFASRFGMSYRVVCLAIRMELQLAVIMIFSMGSPLGGFWMIYRAIRDEKRPIPYVLLAFVPLAFLWYYVERVRPVRDGK
jgi:hypothetical protein